MRLALRFLPAFLALVLALGAAPAVAQDADGGAQRERAGDAGMRELLRDLPPERRREIRERWQQASPEERRVMRRRMRVPADPVDATPDVELANRRALDDAGEPYTPPQARMAMSSIQRRLGARVIYMDTVDI